MLYDAKQKKSARKNNDQKVRREEKTMSTELRDVPGTMITQTRFFGGAERGTCLLLRMPDLYISVTREQAIKLAVELVLFAEGFEVVAGREDVSPHYSFNSTFPINVTEKEKSDE
jgi:hypothetical protein